MSIATEKARIKGNVTSALAAIAGKGVTVPEGSNSDALEGLIKAIEAGGGGVNGIYCEINNIDKVNYVHFLCDFVPNHIAIIGPTSNTGNDNVGLALHIENSDGTIYQEKRRYQSTNYITGTSVTDGSLFTVTRAKDSSGIYAMRVKINDTDTENGKTFSIKTYRLIAVRL